MRTFGSSQTQNLIEKPVKHGPLLFQMPWANPILHPTTMIRREVLERLGGYREVQSPDLNLWTRVLLDYKVENIPRIMVHYRVHGLQTSRKNYSIQNNEVVYRDRERFISDKFGFSVAKFFDRDVHQLLSRRNVGNLEVSNRSGEVRRRAFSFLLKYWQGVIAELNLRSELEPLESLKVAIPAIHRLVRP